jgi:hypothetical protein
MSDRRGFASFLTLALCLVSHCAEAHAGPNGLDANGDGGPFLPVLVNMASFVTDPALRLISLAMSCFVLFVNVHRREGGATLMSVIAALVMVYGPLLLVNVFDLPVTTVHSTSWTILNAMVNNGAPIAILFVVLIGMIGRSHAMMGASTRAAELDELNRPVPRVRDIPRPLVQPLELSADEVESQRAIARQVDPVLVFDETQRNQRKVIL